MSTTGGPEYLETGGGVPPEKDARPSDRRKRVIALGGLLGAAVVVGGAAWAATSFFATGSQPAQALPSSTLVYASIDLDPSGGQKIEAIRTLRKFPAFRDEVDLETDDDLREKLFDELVASGECEGVDFAEDVEPWLGSRAAVAGIDTGEEEPTPVVVVQVSDAAAAEEGLAAVVEGCGGDLDPESGAWEVRGDWVLIGEDAEVLSRVADDAEAGSLADDDEFGRWTSEAGEDGIMSMYVAKEAAGMFSGLADGLATPMMPPLDPGGDPFGESGGMEGMEGMEGSGAAADELEAMIEEFDGMAMTVRFDDGALEVEYAMSNYQPGLTEHFLDEAGVDLVASLPEDTIAAMGIGFDEGWVEAMLDYVASFDSDEVDVEELMAEAEAETGLSLPEDLETLVGDGVAISLGSGIDPDAVANGGPGELPLGFKIASDADDVQAVLDKLKEQAGPELAPYLEVSEGDDAAVLVLREDYRSALEEDGSLGESEAFENVIEDGAQGVVFVDFDADDGWLVRLAEEAGPEVSENLAPLSAFGVSAWMDDEVIHGVVKVTTD